MRYRHVVQCAAFIISIGILLLVPLTQAQEPPPPRPLYEGAETLPHRHMDAPPRDQGDIAAADVAAWSRIAFQSYRDSNWEIYRADGNGANQSRVTANGAADIYPRFNRGCTYLAFASKRTGNYEIFTQSIGSGWARQITDTSADEFYPAWSPDGRRIVFQSNRDGQAEIYVMDETGYGQTRLTWNPAYDGMPAWSPDGTKIAFISTRSGGYRVWVMNADGSGQTQLSNQAYSAHPVWSPDGTQIAYDADGNGDTWQEVWLMNADGSNQRQVYQPSEPQTDAWVYSWSPDGRYVAFSRISWIYYEGNWYWTTGYLDAWDSTTGSVVRLINHYLEADWHPDWQTTDIYAPTASVQALPAQSPGPFTVRWSGADNGPAGLKSYDVQVRDGIGGTWTDWQMGTTATAASYPGIGGHTYYFRCRARDNAYNVGAWPAEYQAFTTVEALPPTATVNPLPAYARGGVSVSWGGSDPGGSGIKTYDVQVRDGASGAWTDWQVGTSATSATFSGTAGHTYYFRVRATDRAQNLGSWSAGENAYTTLYDWLVSGAVRDNAGAIIVGATITATPAVLAAVPSNHMGIYEGYGLAGTGTYTLTWGKNGYGSLPPTGLGTAQDAHVDVILPPADNVVRNWGFEDSVLKTSNWLTSGVITPVITNTVRHTGNRSVLLGIPFRFAPVVNISNNPGVAPSGDMGPAITVDNRGSLHVVWADNTPGADSILYAYKPRGGDWSVPICISDNPPADNPRITVDASDNLHVVWNRYLSIVYATKPKEGEWSTPAAIPDADGYHPGIAVDGTGTVHILWGGRADGGSNAVLYTAKPVSDDWASPIVVVYTGNDPVADPALAFGPGDTLHALWYQGMYASSIWQVIYASKPRGGSWSTPINLSGNSSYSAWLPDLAVDPGGTLHAVWRNFDPANYGIVYASKHDAGPWTLPTNIVLGGADSPAIAVRGTDVHVVCHRLDALYNYDILYARKVGDADWNDPVNLSNNPGGSGHPDIALDESGGPHIVWHDSTTGDEIYYIGPVYTAQTGDSTIAQVVSVPVTMSTPILSFFYQLGGASAAGGTYFNVRVDNGITPTLLFSTTSNTNIWTHRWFDLTPWAGQTITLTFNVHNEAGIPCTWAYLDEVTIGSAYPDLWISKSGAPAAALPGEPVVYTIAYGNQGGAAAHGVWITDTLPGELLFVSASPAPMSVTPTLAWDVGSVPARSGPFTIIVTATVAPTVTPFRYYTNTVRIHTPATELEQANNTDQATTFVGRWLYLPLTMKEW